MLDLKALRRDPDAARTALSRRGEEGPRHLDRALALDVRRRELLPEVESRRAEQHAASDAIATARRSGEDAAEAIGRMREVAAAAKVLQEELQTVEAELADLQLRLPNLPHPEAPAEDTTVREVGERRIDGLGLRVGLPGNPPAEARDHLALAGDRLDMERGARLSGSRFAYLRGELVLLELALVRWALERLGGAGFEPVIPPVLVREEALRGTGFLPDTEQQLYALPGDDLYLTGTSEVALASLHADEVLGDETLPRRYAGFSPCFRREAGSAGRDTRGMFRVHQFDKVEMFSFVDPADAEDEHARLLALEEGILTDLGIPYRVVDIAVDDLGASAARKYDCEAWLPSQEQYRELTSTSNTTEFQARRLRIRHRAEGGRPSPVATLNGTAVAVGRTMIALLEHGQREDGSVVLPETLVAAGAPAVLPAAA